MTLAIALRTDRFDFGLTIEQHSDMGLLLLALALAVALLGLALDFLLVQAGGWVAVWPVTLGLGMALGLLGWEVLRCYDR